MPFPSKGRKTKQPPPAKDDYAKKKVGSKKRKGKGRDASGDARMANMYGDLDL